MCQLITTVLKEKRYDARYGDYLAGIYTAVVSALKPVVHRPGPFCNAPSTNLT